MSEAFLDFSAANRCRYLPGPTGHYESWFQRANHPDRPLALWLRYTLFQPPGRSEDAVGEVWAIWFDGEHQRIRAAKRRVPFSECAMNGDVISIGGSTQSPAEITGSALMPDGGALGWSLAVSGKAPPLLLLPAALYGTRLPAAKALVTRPDAHFTGSIEVDGERIELSDWPGTLNHNWGCRHTDHYAWGQVAGFDGAPEVFLECATARLRLAGVWTPPMSLIVLRIGGEELRMNGLLRALRNTGTLDRFDWRIEAEQHGVRITVHIHASRVDFAGLRNDNPGRPQKTCLNSKLAACELTLERRGEPPRRLRSAHGAAFEILTDGETFGVPVLL